MGKNNEKRMVGDTGYEVRQTFWIGGKEIVLAERQDAPDNMMYLIGQYTDKGFFTEYSQLIKCDDYLEAVQDFTKRINTETASIRLKRDALNLPAKLFTATDCYPLDRGESIKDRVVVIKPSVLVPEYRRGDVQLVYAVSGFGTSANSRGSAVYCYHLNDGAHTRFERRDISGVVKELPAWAEKSLARIRLEIDKPAETKEFAGNYEIVERIEAGHKVFALGHCESAPCPWGTWQGRRSSVGDFDWGHYFNDYESAKTDMHDRAAEEQRHLDNKKRDGKGR
jgi:hypothetical protein